VLGNPTLLRDRGVVPDGLVDRADALARAGKTPVYVVKRAPQGAARPLGLLAVANTPKPTSAEAVRQLRALRPEV
jgi:cation transport ATPase